MLTSSGRCGVVILALLLASANGARGDPLQGSIVAWGCGSPYDDGQCNVPAPNTDFVRVAAGDYYSLGLKADGSIAAWGSNYFGQLNVPAPNTGFIGIASGGFHSLGLKADGSIAAWGRSDYGLTNVPAPNAGFAGVAAGDYHSLGLKADGSIVAWGCGDPFYNYGQCNVPAPNTGFVSVAAGRYHNLGLKSDGSIVAWGYNGQGRTDVPAPNTGFVSVAAGGGHSLGLKADGSIVAWGWNDYGQTNVPVPNDEFVAVAGGYVHSLGLKSDGSIVTWGCGSPYNYGQCSLPEPNSGFVSVAAGEWHSLGIGSASVGDPAGKCCFENGQGSMECANLTESKCSVAGDPHLWEEGQFCGQGGVGCPLAACIGVTASCLLSHNTPGCNHPYCCTDVCTSHGPAGAFCCNTAWDTACVALAEIDCQLPPDNDECAPGSGFNETGAITIPVPGSVATNNTRATTSASDPGFCCHGGVSSCIGGTNDGLPCVVAGDCPSGSCPTPSPMPGALGYGSIWFKFVQPAGQTRAGISTCTSNSPALDSVLQVFRATDPSSVQSACASLDPIACNDDAPNCGSSGRNSRLCVEGLTPGETYYIVVAAKTPTYLGQYRVTITTTCTSGDFSCSARGSCCDTNGTDQGCVDNVSQSLCTGPDKVWTENGQCADQECNCIMDCNGATCGDDGCGGSCGTCDDGNPCNGIETCGPNRTCVAGQPPNCDDHNACNGAETCDPDSGCRPGQPLHCDNGVACDGQEFCNPTSGCVAGTPVNCDDGLDCTADTCNEPTGTCTHDDAGCAIPTVSEWGLVVLTLLLLTGAKVHFGRRQAMA